MAKENALYAPVLQPCVAVMSSNGCVPLLPVGIQDVTTARSMIALQTSDTSSSSNKVLSPNKQTDADFDQMHVDQGHS